MSFNKKMLSLAMVGALPLAAAMPGVAVADPEPWVGQMEFVPYNFNPLNWEFCNGQLMPIADNSALYSLLGTTFGGDGRTNFALPDMRGRSPVHAGTGPGMSTLTLGQRGGVGKLTLTVNNLPAHTHAATAESSSTLSGSTTSKLMAAGTAGTSGTAAGNSLPTGSSLNKLYSTDAPSVEMNAGSVKTTLDGASVTTNTTITVANTGTGAPIENYHPYLVLNCIIATQGIYPLRN